jgi:hypothetical protein
MKTDELAASTVKKKAFVDWRPGHPHRNPTIKGKVME